MYNDQTCHSRKKNYWEQNNWFWKQKFRKKLICFWWWNRRDKRFEKNNWWWKLKSFHHYFDEWNVFLENVVSTLMKKIKSRVLTYASCINLESMTKKNSQRFNVFNVENFVNLLSNTKKSTIKTKEKTNERNNSLISATLMISWTSTKI